MILKHTYITENLGVVHKAKEEESMRNSSIKKSRPLYISLHIFFSPLFIMATWCSTTWIYHSWFNQFLIARNLGLFSFFFLFGQNSLSDNEYPCNINLCTDLFALLQLNLGRKSTYMKRIFKACNHFKATLQTFEFYFDGQNLI